MLRGKRSTRNTLGIFVVQFLVLGTGTLPMHSGFAVLLQNTAPLYRLQPTQPSHAYLFISLYFISFPILAAAFACSRIDKTSPKLRHKA